MRLAIILASFIMIFSVPSSASEVDPDPGLHDWVLDNTEIIPVIRVADRFMRDELLCLSLNLYHEARGSSQDDQEGTISVVFNRVINVNWPNNVCDVIWERSWVSYLDRTIAQFTWTLDGRGDHPRDRTAWRSAQQVAYKNYTDPARIDKTNGATHYHALTISPKWSKRGFNKIKLGLHMYMKLL